MTNIKGQVVKDIAVNGKEITINIEDLADGTYFLKLKNSEIQNFKTVFKL